MYIYIYGVRPQTPPLTADPEVLCNQKDLVDFDTYTNKTHIPSPHIHTPPGAYMYIQQEYTHIVVHKHKRSQLF